MTSALCVEAPFNCSTSVVVFHVQDMFLGKTFARPFVYRCTNTSMVGSEPHYLAVLQLDRPVSTSVASPVIIRHTPLPRNALITTLGKPSSIQSIMSDSNTSKFYSIQSLVHHNRGCVSPLHKSFNNPFCTPD